MRVKKKVIHRTAKMKKFYIPQTCSKEMARGWKPNMKTMWYLKNYTACPLVQWGKKN